MAVLARHAHTPCRRPRAAGAHDGEDASGMFFGQSSFAAASIVRENSVVNVKDLINNEDELKLLTRELLPRMIAWWREGKWPIETIVKLFPAKNVNEALTGMGTGSVIKAVLVW